MSVDQGNEDVPALLASQTLGEGHLLFFANASSLSRVEDALTGDLTAHGLIVEKASQDVLCVLPTRGAIEKEATRAKLLKPVASELSGNTAGAFERFDHEARALYEGVDSLDFFTGGEINRMAYRIMHFNIKVRTRRVGTYLMQMLHGLACASAQQQWRRYNTMAQSC